MRMYDIIMKKRNGSELSKEEIDFFVQGYTAGDIPDYQVSALMMAIYFRKMTKEEKQASPHASACVHAEGVQPAAKQPLQPAHPQNFILDEIPH